VGLRIDAPSTDTGMQAWNAATLAQERERFLAAHPDMSGCLGLLDDCIARYPQILAGRLDPMTVLFPGGSMERVASIYANNEVQDLFNHHVADTVARWCLAQWNTAPSRCLRIVEIGAGTGSTTAAILAALPQGVAVDYCFTDISPAILARAKQRFRNLRFALLDIERDPCTQGFRDGEADLVIANNVLHATADIAIALNNVHRLSASGGVLVLNEQTELQPFIHLIFGLTSGWWRFADALRQKAQSPILSAAQWTDALRQAGFEVQPEAYGTEAGQAVFVAHVIERESKMARDASTASTSSSGNAALAAIRHTVAELTGMDGNDIDPDTALIDLGLDSLMLVQMRTLLANKFGLEVEMADFYGDLDTVAKLAKVASATAPAQTTIPAPHIPASSPLDAWNAGGVVEQIHTLVQPSHPHPNPPPTRGRERVGEFSASFAANAAPQPDLARLMSQQLEAMSRMISEQNALLAGAPAAVPQVAQVAPAPAAKAPSSSKTNTPNFRSLKLDPDKLTPQQQTFVEELARRYAARTPSSKALADRSRHTLADWKNTLSFRCTLKEMMYPIVATTSHGSHFTDLDGNDFLDMTMGCGIALLGHSPESVTKAVHAQTDASFAIGPQTPLAAEVAERISRLTGMERITFCNTGAEAVMMAVRIARAVTGRSKLVVFNGAYHGTWDGVLGVEHEGRTHPIAAGIPQGMVDDLLILNYGTDEALATLREQIADIAAVLVEPVQSRRPGFHPAEFLKQLRSITEQSGAALIFDEMITGFRILPGGGQAYYGVRADLATYGKVIGGGLPLSVVAGNARFMDVVDGGSWRYGDDSLPQSEVIYFGGTYVKHPLALAAAKAALDCIERIGVKGYEELNQRSKRMADALNAWFTQESVPLQLAHFGSLFRIDGTGRYSTIMQPIELDLFFLLLNLRSIYVWERRICFLSFAHTDAEIDHLIECVKEAVLELRAAGFEFSSPLPQAGHKRGFAKHALRRWSRIGMQANPWGAERGPGVRVPIREPLLANTLPCRARGGLQAPAVPQAGSMLPETPAPPPTLSRLRERELNTSPAASAQRRMFALAEIEGPSVVYNVPLAIRLHGTLDLPRLEQSLATLVTRHPALRTRFAVEDDALVQKVDAAIPFAIDTIEADEPHITERLNAFIRPFVLKTGPLFRAGIVRLAADRHVLIMDAHHIVVDGLSLNILAQELMASYGGQPLPETGAGMIDYALAEAAYLNSEASRRDAAYWHEQFRTVPEPLQLPLDHPRPLRRRHQGADLLATLDDVATARLKAAARAHKMPVFPLLLTLYAVLLHRLSAQDDIVIGLPVGGRTDPRFRRTVGMLAATLPLRMSAKPGETLAACARACHKSFLASLDHQAYPLEALIASLDLPRDTSRNPLFDTMFIYEDGNDRVYRMTGLTCEPEEVSRHAAMFDIAMEVVEAEGELKLRCEYDVDLFSQATAQGVLDLYVRLLHLAPDMLDQPVGDLNLVDAKQCNTILSWGDGGPAAEHGTVLQAFDAQLARLPDAPALICGSTTLSYRELNQRANRLAHALLADGPLPPDTPIALVARRDAGLLTGMLGILRAGAAYVPIDPDFPADRVRLMLDASGCRHVLASDGLMGDLPAPAAARILSLDTIDETLPDTAPQCAPIPEQLAYIIFTSGSTGTPKGAMLTHRNAAAFFASLPQVFGFAPGDRMLGVTTVSFDIAGLELLGALCCGMTVVLASEKQAREPALLLELIGREKVNVMQMTPTRLKMLLDILPPAGERAGQLSCIRTLLIGGEALPQSLADQLRTWTQHTRVFNVYGPTETTIWSAWWSLTEGPVSLGRPFPGERLLLLSAQHRLQPPGAVGEIAIAGIGVARGYLNDPARSAERFIHLPGIDGLVYLTGDLGRWRTDGSLEYLGRRDDQIKIRGMRIELGDIEHQLRLLPDITDAAAAVRKNALGEDEIVAYLVGPQSDIDAAALRAMLASCLPAPMIPSRFMILPALPQTPNGKTDRRALPAPQAQLEQRSQRTPNGPVEEALTRIFSEVLGNDVGPDDDFFLVGGESIRALRLAARVRAAGLVFELQDLFRWPTPAALAANLKPLDQMEKSGDDNAIGALSGLGDAELADLIS